MRPLANAKSAPRAQAMMSTAMVHSLTRCLYYTPPNLFVKSSINADEMLVREATIEDEMALEIGLPR
jgi:hypothetical protein